MSVSSNGFISSPVSINDVVTALGETSYNLSDLCSSPKINKKSWNKPYAFGDYDTSPDYETIRLHNCGMTPKGIIYKDGSYISETWGLYSPPLKGLDWCRLGDFSYYSKTSSNCITSVSITTNNPNNNKKLMYDCLVKAVIKFNNNGVNISDCYDPNNSNSSIYDYHWTLLFGSVLDNISGFNYAIVKLSSDTIGDMIDMSDESCTLTFTFDSDIYESMIDDWDNNFELLAVVCAAPYLDTDEYGYVTQDDTSFDGLHLVSLDMWGLEAISTNCIFHTNLSEIDDYISLTKILDISLDSTELPTIVTTNIKGLSGYPTATSILLTGYNWNPLEDRYGKNKRFVHGKITIDTDSWTSPLSGVRNYIVASVPSSSSDLVNNDGPEWLDPPIGGQYLTGQLTVYYQIIGLGGIILGGATPLSKTFSISYYKPDLFVG